MIQNLSELNIGETATVSNIITTGSMRRRFLDLGIVEVTKISCLHKSPSGNPVAYSIRGAVIAIRTDDSKNILISCSNNE